MIECQQNTRLLSASADRPLEEKERQQVDEHFEICPACRRCAGQFAVLRESVRRLREQRLES